MKISSMTPRAEIEFPVYFKKNFERATSGSFLSLKSLPFLFLDLTNTVGRRYKKTPTPWRSAGLVDDSNIYEWEITIVG